MTCRVALLLAAALAVSTAPAGADNLLLALSSQQITIASNYAGADVTLFGMIRRDDRTAGPADLQDLVVTVRGPVTTLVVRQKEPAGPIWTNRAARRFLRVPSYLAVLSTRPLAAIFQFGARVPDGLGLLATASAARPRSEPRLAAEEDAAFVSALVRLQTGRRLWREDPQGVSFLDRAAFRSTIHLPPDVPFGPFEVEVRLYADGRLAARETIAFRVVKAGFEAWVAEIAESRGFAYGVGTAILALVFGWTASVAFRRD